jgi:hypothetical protein
MTNVLEAKAALDRAEAAEKKDQRRKLIAQLAEVHKARTRANADYLKIAGQVKRERELKHELRFKIEHCDSLLAQHMKQKPAVADVLPEDPDSSQWMVDHTMMENARATLQEQLRSVPNSLTIEAMAFEGPGGKLAVLENSERNLLGLLDPEGRDAWLRGGLFAVGDM